MKTRVILLTLCSALSLGTASWAAAPKSQTAHYEMKLKSGSFGDMGVRKLWVKGDNVRWEYMSAGLPLKLIKNKQGVFMLHPWRKYAAKYPQGANRGNTMVLFPGPSGPLDAFLKSVNAKKAGQQTINKERCRVYTYVEPIGKRTCKIWISTKADKPVQVQLAGVHGKADSMTATYTKFVLGEKVSDSLFELPKGFSVKPMPNPKLTSTNIGKGDKKGSI